MKTYGIIVAMESEIKYLKQVLNFQKKTVFANKVFYEAIYQNNLIIFTTSGIGKVNAGVTTMLLIEHYHPQLIINTGIAGGFRQDIQTLDIVVADKVFYCDVDMTSPIAGGYRMGQIEGLPESFKPDFELLENEKDIIFGTILTGDQFRDNYEICSNIVKQDFPLENVVAFDMESASIAQICTMNDVDFLIIRAISDIIGSTKELDYQIFSKKAIDKVSTKVLEIIKK